MSLTLQRNRFLPLVSPPTSPNHQLLTPQSHSTPNRYLLSASSDFDSPSPIDSPLHSPAQRAHDSRLASSSWVQVEGQTATPESSPHRPRVHPSSMNGLASEQLNVLCRHPLSVAQHLDSSHSHDMTTSDPVGISRLSSPFMDGESVVGEATHTRQSSTIPSPLHFNDDDVFAADSSPGSSVLLDGSLPRPHTPLLLFPASVPITSPKSSLAVEVDLCSKSGYCQATHVLHDHQARQPKRSLMEADLTGYDHAPHLPSVLINLGKDRKVTLFQETSEESFEESLMAGGYGKYKTADWIRQPQFPFASFSPSVGESPLVLSEEISRPAPLTEHEQRKRRRLDAFHPKSIDYAPKKLRPMNFDGLGRVVIGLDDHELSAVLRGTPSKRRVSSRRKRKGVEASKENQSSSMDVVQIRPNWPDSEYPWRMRVEETAKMLKAEDDGKERRIARWMDGSTDEEEESDQKLPSEYSDPADARIALLAKFGALLPRRVQANTSKEDSTICICKGKDDGRPSVLCETCTTWYHLSCIGIANPKELGEDEDPWYCSRCMRKQSVPDLMEASLLSKEPVLVPNTEDVHPIQVWDPPFYQPPVSQDSPMIWCSTHPPCTPTRRPSSLDASFSSESRYLPITPSHGLGADPTIYHFQNSSLEDSPFDPTSTPSRGFKLGITPRDGLWSNRGSFFQTPSKSSHRSARQTADETRSIYRYLLRGESPTRNLRSEPTQSPSPPRISIRSSFVPLSDLEDSPIMRSRGIEQLQYRD